MKLLIIVPIIFALTGCVMGAPNLTPDQAARVDQIEILEEGQFPDKEYSTIDDISAADCSGAPYGGRVWGDAEKAIETLKAKAASLDADAIINTSCSAAPFVNNCWAAKLCSGQAVKWSQT